MALALALSGSPAGLRGVTVLAVQGTSFAKEPHFFFAFDRNRAQKESVLSPSMHPVPCLRGNHPPISSSEIAAYLCQTSSIMSAHKAEPEQSISLYPAHLCGQSTSVTQCASLAVLIRAARACRLHPWCIWDVRWILPGIALFPHLLHPPGSAVLFKTACCFSSTRDIISVHTARYIGGWKHTKESKFRFNKKRDSSQQARSLHSPGLTDISFSLCC